MLKYRSHKRPDLCWSCLGTCRLGRTRHGTVGQRGLFQPSLPLSCSSSASPWSLRGSLQFLLLQVLRSSRQDCSSRTNRGENSPNCGRKLTLFHRRKQETRDKECDSHTREKSDCATFTVSPCHRHRLCTCRGLAKTHEPEQYCTRTHHSEWEGISGGMALRVSFYLSCIIVWKVAVSGGIGERDQTPRFPIASIIDVHGMATSNVIGYCACYAGRTSVGSVIVKSRVFPVNDIKPFQIVGGCPTPPIDKVIPIETSA
jgi:hypothetical protein